MLANFKIVARFSWMFKSLSLKRLGKLREIALAILFFFGGLLFISSTYFLPVN